MSRTHSFKKKFKNHFSVFIACFDRKGNPIQLLEEIHENSLFKVFNKYINTPSIFFTIYAKEKCLGLISSDLCISVISRRLECFG